MSTPTTRVQTFTELAYGLFIHYGIYAQLGKGEWVMRKSHIPRERYESLAETFTAERFDGRKIARLARDAGMRYACLTTRHHDGFSLYDCRGLSRYDAPHSVTRRDLVADFVEGCRSENIVPFFYHTTIDWHHPDFQSDFPAYLDYLRESVRILCKYYGPIGGFWFDGNWNRPDVDWQEDQLYEMIRKYQPDAIIVNNTGMEARGGITHPEIDCVTYERGCPDMPPGSSSRPLAAEACDTLKSHWGYVAKDFNYLSPREIIQNLCACRRVGANYLLNVGPEPDGRIPLYEQEALRKAGEWIRLAGDVLYRGRPYVWQKNGKDFILAMDGRLFAFLHDIRVQADVAVLGSSGPGLRSFRGVTQNVHSLRWQDEDVELSFTQQTDQGLLEINVPPSPSGSDMVVGIAVMECDL